ncbi:MAG: hypothetical protein ACLTCI_02050 [[Clostridium] nexile]
MRKRQRLSRRLQQRKRQRLSRRLQQRKKGDYRGSPSRGRDEIIEEAPSEEEEASEEPQVLDETEDEDVSKEIFLKVLK